MRSKGFQFMSQTPASKLDGQAVSEQVDEQLTLGICDPDILSPYEYEEVEPGCIRLFELFPGHGHDRIEGALRSVVLAEAYEMYEAVSYAWGDSTFQHTIVCNGSGICVTKNLHQALLRLRKSDASMMLWLDGICIDQGTAPASLLARSEQVVQMSDIYTKASRVVVDLGDTDQDFSYLINRLEQYTKIDPDPTQHLLSGPITLPGSDGPDVKDSQLWVQLMQFIRLPWFSRLWCFQEFVLAPRIATLCGSRFISDFDLHLGISRALFRLQLSMAELLPTVVKEAWFDLEGLQRCQSVLFRKQTIRDERLGNKQMTWEAAMVVGRLLKVTDPRDRLYALYALLPREIAAGFSVDYTEPVEAFQQRLTLHLIRRNYGIWALMHACGPSDEQPSWIVSLYRDGQRYWKQEQLAIFAGSIDDFKTYPSSSAWRAGGSSAFTLRPGTTADELHAQGYVVDRISVMSDKLLPTNAEDIEQSVDVFFGWIANVIRWSQTVGIPEDVLWRVLIFDGYGEARLNPDYADTDKRNAAVASYGQYLKRFLLSDRKESVDSLPLAIPLLQWIALGMQNMCVATTADGIVAVVPYTTIIGDRVAVLTGVNSPFIFRPKDGQYQLIGPCYLHGLMDGQILDREDWNPRLLTII